MKRIFSVITLMILGVVLVACGNRAPYDLETETEIIVGLEAAYAPFNWMEPSANEHTYQLGNQSGYVDGYDVTVAKSIAASLGKTLVIKAIDWDGLIPALKSGEIDLIIAGMSPTAEREKQISFSNNYYRSEVVMVVNTAGKYTTATKLSDFNGAKLVAQRGTLYDGLITDQIPGATHQVPLDAYSDLAQAVGAQTADGFVAELPVAQAIVAANANLVMIKFEGTNGFVLDDSDITVSIGVRKNDSALLEALNTALAAITQTQRNTWMEQAISRQES